MSGNIDDLPDRPPETDADGSTDADVSTDQTTLEDVDLTRLDGDADVLLLGPMRGSIDDVACSALMADWPVGERNVLFVSFTQPADDRLALLRATHETMPERVCVVSGADRYASETETDGDDGSTTLTVDVVRDPSDLPRLGMTISRAVDEWDDEVDPLLCFHSLTALLQYTAPKRAFRFVHLLQNRLQGPAHYHMDVDAHDRQTVATLQPLFDAIVEYDADGNVTVTD